MTMSPVDFDDSVGNVQVSSSSGVVVDASKFSGGDLRAEAL
jgi:hypothetical protein